MDSDFYAFVEKPTSWAYSIKIKKGTYEGVIVTYGRVQVVEDKAAGQAKLNFTFAINESPKFDKKELENDLQFKNVLGDMLSHILLNALDTGKFKLGNGRKPSSNDSQKTGP